MKNLLIWVCLLLTGTSFGQNYSFIAYSNADGLPQSQVQCITQDLQGYLWVGTLGGLAKFNGKKFIPFPVERGLLNNRISTVQAIGDDIWVGHEGGISHIHKGKARNWTLNGDDQSINVTDIVSFKGEIIASVEGGGLYHIKNGKLTKTKLPNEDASTCRDLEIINGILYIATRDGLYSTSNGRTFYHNSKFESRSISGIVHVGGKVLISTFFRGYFETTDKFKSFDSIPLLQPELYISSAFADRNKNLWLLSPEGIIRIKPDHSQLLINESKGLPVNSINCAFQDKEGNLWFGSEGKGLLRLSSQTLVHYNFKTGLPSDLILSSNQESENSFLFGTYDKGLFRMKQNGIAETLSVPATTIWGIERFNGQKWFATDQGLFVQLAQNSYKQINFTESPNTVRLIKKMPDNRLFVAGEEHFGWIKPMSTQFEQTIAINPGKIGIIRDAIYFNSSIYCATSNGLYILNENNQLRRIKQFTSGLACLNLDDQNRLWIGTEDGLFVYDGIQYKSIKIGDNSGARFINFITKIKESFIIGTNDGVFLFDTSYEIPKMIRHIGLNNGMINLETNINSGFYDGKHLWFGTAEGIQRLNVNAENISTLQEIAPKLTVTSILLNYQNFNYLDFASGISKDGLPQNLSLPYTKNNLTIDLDGLLFSDPGAVTFQYWLEGLDADWSPRTNNPTIILSNLPDGDYTLHIRAVSETGMISKNIILPINITPPFWRRWWFFLLIAVILTVSIREYFRWQIRRERERNYKENLENKTRLLALEQQSLNASMNRHFIFNSLNSIQYFINTQDKLSANRYLTNFAKLIRKNLDSAAEGDNIVTLAQELERLELYLSLESMRFKDRFSYEIIDKDIDTENILVPAMLLQPFVENSIIHGILPNEDKKGEIKVIVKAIGDQLEICLDDNGIGIDFSLTKKAAFKGDHKSQGMEITSKRISLIRKMMKKDYELIGPFQMTNPDSSIKGTRVLIKIPLDHLDY